jgi:hypothetical protein
MISRRTTLKDKEKGRGVVSLVARLKNERGRAS